jgi:hypothetical protein
MMPIEKSHAQPDQRFQFSLRSRCTAVLAGLRTLMPKITRAVHAAATRCTKRPPILEGQEEREGHRTPAEHEQCHRDAQTKSRPLHPLLRW